MGDLKPLGSEKLQGMDKIKRMLEISKFKENIPQPINETSKDQYRITLADGNEYQIVREKAGYIIKKTITESVAEYIDPIKHRKYYPSYSQALKRLNLMAKETNTLFENEEGISLFEQKKYVLKTPKPKAPAPEDEVENVPPPAEPSTPMPPPASPPSGNTPPPPPGEGEPPMPDETEPPMPDEENSDDQSDYEDTPPSSEDDQEEVVTFKSIQKLVGRLGQKLRTINSDEENQLSSKDVKYVINSILSALDLENLDEDDREQIIGKLEGEEDLENEKGNEMSDDEELPPPGEPEPTEPSEGYYEMKESNVWQNMAGNMVSKRFTDSMTPHEFKEEDEMNHVSMIADNMFMEHKVGDILEKYFHQSKSEKKFNKNLMESRKIENTKKTKFLNNEIKRLSESIIQEVSARKLIEKYPGLSFIGKSNKKNLVFENSKLKQFKITPEGEVL
jgi:hypothetical protein